MRVKALASFRSKLLKPCKKLLPIFKLRLKKPVYIRAPRPPTKAPKSTRKPLSGLLGGLFSSSSSCSRKAGRPTTRFSERASKATIMHFPSPLIGGKREAGPGVDDVDDSCRSFENYLAEMIVEEGKLRDLMDVEELLYCWKSLKCPVFIDLVGRFYGELCKDLFSAEADEVDTPQ